MAVRKPFLLRMQTGQYAGGVLQVGAEAAQCDNVPDSICANCVDDRFALLVLCRAIVR